MFWTNFVGEAVLNPDYEGYVAGRCEVNTRDSIYPIEEYRYFTKDPSIHDFINKWDFKTVSKTQLKEIETILKTKYNG